MDNLETADLLLKGLLFELPEEDREATLQLIDSLYQPFEKIFEDPSDMGIVAISLVVTKLGLKMQEM